MKGDTLTVKWKRLPLEDRMLVLLGLMGIVAVLLFGIGYKLGVAHMYQYVEDTLANCICSKMPFI